MLASGLHCSCIWANTSQTQCGHLLQHQYHVYTSMSHPCVYICVPNVCIAPAWLKKCLHQDIPLCLMLTMAAGVCQGNEASSSGQGALQKGTLTVGLSFEPIHDSLHTTYLLSCTSFQQQGLCLKHALLGKTVYCILLTCCLTMQHGAGPHTELSRACGQGLAAQGMRFCTLVL